MLQRLKAKQARSARERGSAWPRDRRRLGRPAPTAEFAGGRAQRKPTSRALLPLTPGNEKSAVGRSSFL
jgi:hypothetical protein